MNEIMRKIKEVDKKHVYCYYAVCSDDKDVAEGAHVDHSFACVISADYRTDVELDGTCATIIDFDCLADDSANADNLEKLKKAIELDSSRHCNQHQYIIMGTSYESGWAEGEIMLRNAVCVCKIK